MPTGSPEITLRFLAAPTDVAVDGSVHAGRVLEWIDKAAYACAVGWSGGYCVTAYVGNIEFHRPIESGELVEVQARLIHTGRSSMTILVTVSSADPQQRAFFRATRCQVIFVAVAGDGRPAPVQAWEPRTEADRWWYADAVERKHVRSEIEAAMRTVTYTDAGTAPKVTLRFLAAPTDVNWGGKVHGGTAMRWIDEAAYVCGSRWSKGRCIAVYSGGVRFYRPIHIGHLVEVEARLLHTGTTGMHIAVHVRSADPTGGAMQLTTHCLSVFVALDQFGRPREVPLWTPESAEDRQLDEHARHLVELRAKVPLPESDQDL